MPFKHDPSIPKHMIRVRVGAEVYAAVEARAEADETTVAEYVRAVLARHVEDATVAFDADDPAHWRSVIEWSGAHPALFRKYTGGRDAGLHDDRYSVMAFAHAAGWRP